MKTLITAIAVAGLIVTSAAARTAKVQAGYVDHTNPYFSHSQGNQTFPNPDRDYNGPNVNHSE